MSYDGLREDENIIYVYYGIFNQRTQNIIHDILKFTWGILKTKGHYVPLILPKRRDKSCLILILLMNLDLPKSTFHVKLREDH
jgi:hypothetical protein